MRRASALLATTLFLTSYVPAAADERKLEPLLPNGLQPLARMALAENGRQLVAMETTAALVWDLDKGLLVHTLKGPLKEVRLPGKPPAIEKQPSKLTSLALAGADAWVVVGSDAGEMRIWEAATGKLLHTLKCSRDSNYSVALSADHKWLVTAGGEVVAARELLGQGNRTYQSHQLSGASNMREPFTSVAVSADGKTIAAGLRNVGVQVYGPPPAAGFATGSGLGSRSSVGALAMSADGAWILAGSSNSGVILSDQAAKKTQLFKGPLSPVLAVALAADNKRVAACFVDRTVVLWDATTGKKLQTFVGHSQAVNGVALTPDGKRAWTSSADGTVRLWDADTGKQLCSLVSFEGGKEWVIVTPDGRCDGSPGGLKMIAWRDAGTGERFADDATRQRLQRPGLLATLLKGERPKE
jgi:WD40 repeat protein